MVVGPSGASTAIWIWSAVGEADKTAHALPPTVTEIAVLVPKFTPVTFEDIKDVSYSYQERQRIDYNRQRFVIGTPAEVKSSLDKMATDYQVEELMAANAAFEFEDRLRSYELLAEVVGLQKRSL